MINFLLMVNNRCYNYTNLFFRRSRKLINNVYSGMQCSTCGVRYTPEQAMQYSHHLDWHFRQEQRQLKNSKRKQNSRKYYFNTSDWILFTEDINERGKFIIWFMNTNLILISC